jgi:hypothetical protein
MRRNREGRLIIVGADIMQHVADARTPLETMRPNPRYLWWFIGRSEISMIRPFVDKMR